MIRGAYVKSTFSDYQLSVVVEDFYLDVHEARQFASRMEASITEAYLWLTVSLMPKVGPYLGIIGTLSMIERQRVATDIRRLTDLNRKVHIRKMRSNHGIVYHTITQWDGRRSSVAPSMIHPNQKVLVTIYYNHFGGGGSDDGIILEPFSSPYELK